MVLAAKGGQKTAASYFPQFFLASSDGLITVVELASNGKKMRICRSKRHNHKNFRSLLSYSFRTTNFKYKKQS